MTAPKRVLVVDDELNIRRVLAALLRRDGYEVVTAEDGDEARRLLRRPEAPFQCVLTDLRMPGTDGLALLRWIVRHAPDLPVVMITAHGTVDVAVEALKVGAFDFVTKPFDRDEIRRIVARSVAQETANRLRVAPDVDQPVRDIIGVSPGMKQVYTLIHKVAASPTTILIRGESGTGKELVAKALHQLSDRSGGPFVRVNCTAVPESLFESEFFGHEKGAFTGAVSSRPGRFELAHGGTLFLDEIGELPLAMQVKLLRVLQERSFERVGGIAPVDVDIRLVAATNAPLEQMVDAGTFRSDLLFRLNVVEIQLPPLRDRPEDIPMLVEHFLRRFNERLGRRIQGLEDGVLARLQSYPWAGNVRELENMMERAILLADGERLSTEDFPAVARTRTEAAHATADDLPLPDELPQDVDLKQLVKQQTLRIERMVIARTLSQESGNVTRAARKLGISRKSLQLKMKEYGLRRSKA